MATTSFTDEQLDLAAAAYTKYRKGDPLSDAEVKAGCKVFDALSCMRQLGPQFELPAKELMLLARDFERFAEFRRSGGYTPPPPVPEVELVTCRREPCDDMIDRKGQLTAFCDAGYGTVSCTGCQGDGTRLVPVVTDR